ncbi:hypothetical protein AAHB34_09045 [Paenarthrobacter ureafaciens]
MDFHPGVVEEARPGLQRLSGEDVLRDRQVAEQSRVLVDDGHAVAVCVHGSGEVNILACDADRAGIGVVDAAEHLDASALACAVFSDERQYLAREQRERNIRDGDR